MTSAGAVLEPTARSAPAERPRVASARALRLRIAALLGLALLVYAPAIGCGYMIDDLYQRMALGDLPEIFRQRLDLFGLIRGPEDVALYKRFGLAPWWTSSSLQIDFFRPIPSLTHWLDHALFGFRPEAAHLTSILWYLGAVLLAARLLGRFLPRGSIVLGVAVAVFALDDAHALNVVWISNRNETISGVFVMAAFLAYLRWRDERRLRDAVLALLFQLLGLLSKESAVVLPVLVALHASLFPPAAALAGARSLYSGLRAERRLVAGLLALTLAYVLFYFLNGHGAASLYYVNPMRDPALWAGHFFRSAFYHAVILATGVPLLVLSNTPVHDYPAAAALLALVTLVFFATAWRWLRHERAFWFFVGWMAISQGVLTTSFPDPRLLFLPSIGFAWLVARTMEEAYARWKTSSFARSVLGSLAALHFLVAPALVLTCIHVVKGFQTGFGELERALTATVPYTALPRTGVRVFLVNYHQREASTMFGLHLRSALPTGVDDYSEALAPGIPWREKIRRALELDRVHYHQLSLLGKDVEVTVAGERELVVRAADGRYFPSLFDQLWMTRRGFQLGQELDVGPFRATVQELGADGDVAAVRFSFPEPLSSSSYRFLRWDGTHFEPLKLERAERTALCH